MQSDKRKTPRKPLRYSAWIVNDGLDRINCVLSDISDSGARIEVENPAALPDTFTLHLTQHPGPRRFCTVAWREKGFIGVHFDRRQKAPVATKKEATPPLAPEETAAEPAAAVEEKA
jgi:hypothetical protein